MKKNSHKKEHEDKVAVSSKVAIIILLDNIKSFKFFFEDSVK